MFIGDFPEDFTTVPVIFTTHAAAGGAVAPSSGFEAADVKIYKNGNAAEKTTTNGLTMTSPFDSITGLHCLLIDTSNDTGDAGFWTAGAVYTVVLSPDTETVDSQTVVKNLGTFTIGMNLRAATAGRTVVVDAAGLVDANAVKVGPTGSGTAQTAGNLAALISALSTTGTVTVISPVLSSGNVEIVQGDSYYQADGRELPFESADWPTLTGATVKITATSIDPNSSETLGPVTGVVDVGTGTKEIHFDLSSTNTDVDAGVYDYDLQATLSGGHVVTLGRGKLTVRGSITP